MELLYHYAWHHLMFGRALQTVRGQQIKVLTPGRHNDDAGPDFIGARLLIDGKEWVGNVEIHVKASDWFRHGHDSDNAYLGVVLHVVVVDDARIKRGGGEEIPQVVAVLPERFFLTYSQLTSDLKSVRCAQWLATLPSLIKEDWLETLIHARLESKAQRLLDYNRSCGGDWEQAVFILLSRALGFGLNGLPFEILAKNLPLKIIYHHSDNLMQIEALLFGQAGMLNGSNHIFDEYYQSLCAEYGFLARKYGLRPMDVSLWKYARTRPQNFPHRRIAILAQALYEGLRFSSSLEDADGDYDLLCALFSWKAADYWRNHSAFGKEEELRPAISLSLGSRHLLMINVAAPFYMASAKLSGNFDKAELAFDLLRSLPAEKNSQIRSWETSSVKAKDASRSQALLHLREQYCDRMRCLDCRFGNYLLRSRIRKPSCKEFGENIQ